MTGTDNMHMHIWVILAADIKSEVKFELQAHLDTAMALEAPKLTAAKTSRLIDHI